MKKLFYTLAIAAFALMGVACNRTSEIKVMSYNIRLSSGTIEADSIYHWEHRKQASLELMHQEQPTVFGLQEACPDQMDYMVENLPEYGYIGVGRDDGKRKGEFMSIFYKKDEVELIDGGTFWLSQTPDQVTKGWDAACFRTCTWTILKKKDTGKKFVYLNTHLDHKGQEARKESIKLIVAKAEELTGGKLPVFITADFNSPTTNEIFKPMQSAMKDARVEAPVTDERGTLNCWGTTPPGVVIDHIFFRGAEAQKFEVLRDKDYGAPYVSDHYPVMLTAIL
ncbi:MAG: endonuclease/exonuclease/phosphatase family protein [Alistipes sp.]|nr:endonuclease/exonuclease/phosphatase family protein [Alistipes sp.]MBP3601829.1 endonuclease/exonuclease/phosphatase family protein [Alistipes sp.]